MKVTIYKIVLITFIIMSGYSGAKGQGQKGSLMQYLQIAARENPTVLKTFYEYQAVLQKVPQSGSLPDPELNVGIFLSPMELVGGNQVAEIQLMQMFPWFGVLRNAKDEMSLMANARFESFRDAKLQVFFEVQKTWYELYKINQNIRISEKNLDILKTLERITLVRYKTVSSANNSSVPPGINSTTSSSLAGSASMGGMESAQGNNSSPTPSGSPMQKSSMGSSSGSTGLTDLYRIQIETGNLENNIALLRNQYNTVAAKFNAYLNRAVRTPVSLPDTLAPDKFEVSLLAAEDTMLLKNPMLGMLEYEKQSLDARERMVTKMGYPMVGVGLNYTLINKNEMSTSSMNGSDMVMPMIKVTLPIYRKKYNAMRTETALMKKATEQDYKATSNALQTEYFEAVQAYQDAERRLELYKNQSLLANKSLDIMVRSYASSAGSGLTDILSIRQQTLDYEFKLTEALTDYNTAVAQLKRLMSNTEI
jgi:outer membrane protein TolC